MKMRKWWFTTLRVMAFTKSNDAPPHTQKVSGFRFAKLGLSLQNLMLCFLLVLDLDFINSSVSKLCNSYLSQKIMVRTQNKKLNIVKIRLQKLRVRISSFCLPIEILILSQSVAIWPVVNPFISIFFLLKFSKNL